MEQPKQFVGLCGLFNVGMACIVALYALVGISGYIKYGSDICASITLNLPQHQKKAQAAKLTLALAIFLSFPLQNYVAYEIIWRKMRKRLTQRRMCITDYAMRVLLVVLPWTVALAMPHLGPFIALFGAFCLSLLAVVFPALMDLCVWYPDRYGFGRYKLVRDIIIAILGMFCLVSGCYTSIVEITQHMKT